MPSKPAPAPEFDAVFNELRAILAAWAPRLVVVHDTPDNYSLHTHTIGPSKRPIYFGGVRRGKAYVSYYLMCVYADGAALLDEMSPALKKHMQGKACFNFKTVDPVLFRELRQLTKRGYAAWRKMEWVD